MDAAEAADDSNDTEDEIPADEVLALAHPHVNTRTTDMMTAIRLFCFISPPETVCCTFIVLFIAGKYKSSAAK
jgi:hypothetical protein